MAWYLQDSFGLYSYMWVTVVILLCLSFAKDISTLQISCP